MLAAIVFAAACRVLVPTPERTVRELDRRHALDWALVTAWERERAGRRNDLDALLSERVGQRLELRDALSGHTATVAPALAALLASAALLGLAFGSRSGSAIGADQLAARAAEDLARAIAGAGPDDLDPDARDELTALASRLESEARRAALERRRDGEAHRRPAPRADGARRARGSDGDLARARARRRATRRGAAQRRGLDAPLPVRRGGREEMGEGAGGARPGTVRRDPRAERRTPRGASAGSGGPAATAPDVLDPEGAALRTTWLEPDEAALVDAWVEARRRRSLEAESDSE
ncbi:MAG: hypothetical protein R3F34_19815 [Planctomycetota bacterium]